MIKDKLRERVTSRSSVKPSRTIIRIADFAKLDPEQMDAGLPSRPEKIGQDPDGTSN